MEDKISKPISAVKPSYLPIYVCGNRPLSHSRSLALSLASDTHTLVLTY